ncbi:hypothetical protein M408DRAFT_10641 [Serendipita vermifera MAFF 305830]|uniref:MYND-type domain-containing protein n=1 Tax=Serendipita vermifera MAFF 305830 TaxID=933852 RepID=A0A0C2WFD2_SERVB|nr:hypothetical protein M408DRAFT_10641 [Serendipita vermifera MAFF 305830]
MAVPSSVTSLAEAQKLTKRLLCYDYHPKLEGDIVKLINTSNWHHFCEAGFSKFLIDKASKYDGTKMLPHFAHVLYKSYAIHQSGESQDLTFVSRIREIIVKNYFEPLLSSSPRFGLAALATRPQPDPLADPSGPASCLIVAARIILIMQVSMRLVPSDSFKRTFQPGALKIAILAWCLGRTPEVAFIARAAIAGFTTYGFDEDFPKDILMNGTEYISAEKLAEKCKEVLREGIETRPEYPGSLLSPLKAVAVICHPAPTPSMTTLDQVLVEQNVHHLILRAARQLVDDKKGVCHELQVCSIILWNMTAALPAGSPLRPNFIAECIESHGLLNIFSYVFSNDTDTKEFQDLWVKLFESISHPMECESLDCVCWGRNDSCEDAIRTALERDMLWLNTLSKLRARSKDKSTKESPQRKNTFLEHWFKLGVAVGLQEDAPGAGCQWHECERHGRADEETEWMLRKCSKCWVRYCSVECQRKDWKERHKKVCGTRVAGK